MKIEHVAIWTPDVERLKAFYARYFHAVAGNRYFNPTKQFESYFLTFAAGARLELMHMPSIPASHDSRTTQVMGYIHLAVAAGSKEQVDELTARLAADGYACLDGPRWTGDGYYESVVLDPDGNRVEITI